eukprot:scaffold114280_cov49-Attheya_sp.AAC.2
MRMDGRTSNCDIFWIYSLDFFAIHAIAFVRSNFFIIQVSIVNDVICDVSQERVAIHDSTYLESNHR